MTKCCDVLHSQTFPARLGAVWSERVRRTTETRSYPELRNKLQLCPLRDRAADCVLHVFRRGIALGSHGEAPGHAAHRVQGSVTFGEFRDQKVQVVVDVRQGESRVQQFLLLGLWGFWW